MDEKLIYELFGGSELSEDYLTLLENYQMTKEDGILIRDETIEFVSPLNRYGTYEDYEMMMITIDEFRRRFSDRFKKIHNNEMDLDVLNQYKPNKLYWQITNDRKKTKQLLTPYTGEDFLNDIFLKDLAQNFSWNLEKFLRFPQNIHNSITQKKIVYNYSIVK